MSKISAAFGLQPPIHLVKDFNNTVCFPCEGSGKFNHSLISPGCSYEVHGTYSQSSQPAFSNHPPQHTGALSPFGAYSTPLTKFNQLGLPPPHPPQSRSQRKVIKKTILLTNLSLRDTSRPCSSKSNKITYTVVTQLIISLDSAMGECNVSTAAEMVRCEIGFEVILLDSKLFPILNNDATSGVDFWKSTRKVIAASRSTYESLVGITAGEELKQVEDNAIEVPPSKKAKVNDDLLMELMKLSFIDDVKKA